MIDYFKGEVVPGTDYVCGWSNHGVLALLFSRSPTQYKTREPCTMCLSLCSFLRLSPNCCIVTIQVRPEDGDDEDAALQIPEMGSFLLLSLPTFAD